MYKYICIIGKNTCLVETVHLLVNATEGSGSHYEVESFEKPVLTANISNGIDLRDVHDVSLLLEMRQPYSFEVSTVC